MLFGQRRSLLRVIYNEGRLNEVMFALFTEDLVYQLPLAHGWGMADLKPVALLPEVILTHLRDINTGIFPDGIESLICVCKAPYNQ